MSIIIDRAWGGLDGPVVSAGDRGGDRRGVPKRLMGDWRKDLVTAGAGDTDAVDGFCGESITEVLAVDADVPDELDRKELPEVERDEAEPLDIEIVDDVGRDGVRRGVAAKYGLRDFAGVEGVVGVVGTVGGDAIRGAATARSALPDEFGASSRR